MNVKRKERNEVTEEFTACPKEGFRGFQGRAPSERDSEETVTVSLILIG
jgi:hypothetical protein